MKEAQDRPAAGAAAQQGAPEGRARARSNRGVVAVIVLAALALLGLKWWVDQRGGGRATAAGAAAPQQVSGFTVRVPTDAETAQAVAAAQTALRTQFAGTFVLDARSGAKPVAVIDDFDGDHKPDLAAVVRLAGKVQAGPLPLPFTMSKPIPAGDEPPPPDAYTAADLAGYADFPFLALMGSAGQQGWSHVILDFPRRSTRRIEVWRGTLKLHGALAGDNRMPEEVTPPAGALVFIDDEGEAYAVYLDSRQFRWFPVVEPKKEEEPKARPRQRL